MAASKPTYWLSSKLKVLSHLKSFRDLRVQSGLFPFRLWILSPIVCLENFSLFEVSLTIQRELYLGVLVFQVYLNRFRGKPAITKFDWPFTPNQSSSPPFATDVGSVLHIFIQNTSTWPWLDHLVSGLRSITNAYFYSLSLRLFLSN